MVFTSITSVKYNLLVSFLSHSAACFLSRQPGLPYQPLRQELFRLAAAIDLQLKLAWRQLLNWYLREFFAN